MNDIEVNLLHYNPDALELLLYTKNTRLHSQLSVADIRDWPHEKKLDELSYMKDTIKSSWEFCFYVFEIKNVTRAFTHQLVRTRTASYAQEAQRVVDISDHTYLIPDTVTEHGVMEEYCDAIMTSIGAYQSLIDKGLPRQDARGVIPTNIHTNICMGANLRTLHEMAKLRLCTRTQGEYQNVFRLMRDAVIRVHPWTAEFIQVACAENGICAFPRYTECPIQPLTYNGNSETILKNLSHEDRVKEIKYQAEHVRHEADPVIKDGRTM